MAIINGADGDARGPGLAVEILRPLAVQNTTACPLRAVTVYPVYRGRRMPAPRPPLGGGGGKDGCRPSACRVQGGARSTSIINTAV